MVSDKLKKLVLPVGVLVVVFASLLQVSQPTVMGLAQLPDEGKGLVMTLVTAAVLWALLQLSLVFGIDFSGYAGAIAAVIAPLVVTFIESYLQLIPPVFDGLVLAVIHYLVLLVGSVGAYLLLKRKAVPSLR